MPQPYLSILPGYTGPRPPVSVVILTLNEEINIRACLESCSWADDVHVLDSGSIDSTVGLAAEMGAATHYNRFESFGAQRNWAIDHIPLKHDWVFHLDADERFTAPLVAEIASIIGTHPSQAGYYVANQMIFMGAWIKHASGYPAYQMRLFHKSRMRFADHGHGQRESTEGSLGTLREPYLHHNFSKGLDDWFDRHNKYSRREVDQMLTTDSNASRSTLGGLVSGDAVARRRALKSVAQRMPLRPHLRWLHTVLVKGAWLDGSAGLTYASLLALYERMIELKLKERRSQGVSEQRP